MSSVIFRFAADRDAARLAEIYSYYVLNTAVSFEITAPDEKEFSNRINAAVPRYPFIVCEIDGVIAGYASAHSYRSFAAYDWGAELSIYIDKKFHRLGIGRALYGALIELLRIMGFQTVYGIVALPNPESEKFHHSMGFRLSGTMEKAGFKLGSWYGITNFELAVGDYPESPAKTLSVNELDTAKVEKIFSDFAGMIKI